eukprot:TRINITY_DN102_c0_g1_i2.p1 TRINITY_DN102_c0_g1~~TRINITY_DN102_c0_g1_i2.p1  ORF type:complete len:319 (-),score=113.12 TRINITY_DN102_c0_g1_i2:277-1233(-)
MTYLSLDNIGECAFGISLNAVKQRNSDFVVATLEQSRIVVDRVFNPLLHFNILWELSNLGRQEKKTLKILHGMRDYAIKKRREALNSGEKARQKYFIDILLTSRDEKGGLTDKEIAAEVDTFLFEGHDTTSSGLMWTIYVISQHEQVKKKVFEEIDRVLLSSNMVADFKQIEKLDYLEMVIKESLRLYPPVPVVSRRLDQPLNIGGITALPGTTIDIPALLIHRNEDIWEKADEFIPERFDPSIDTSKRHVFSYIPFSAGSRNCIGSKFATLEIKTVLATLYKQFDIQSTHETIANPYVELVLRNHGPLKFKLIPRFS